MLPKPEGFEAPTRPVDVLFEALRRRRVLEADVVRLSPRNGDRSEEKWDLVFPGLEGVRGVMPASETGLPDARLLRAYVGQRIRVLVKGVDAAAGIAACSRKELVQESLKRLMRELKEGQVIDCTVRDIMGANTRAKLPARVVLDIGGGVLAEVRRRHAVLSEAVPLGAQYQRGQILKALVRRIDHEKGIVDVSIRDTVGDPWGKAEFRRGDRVAGRVVATAPETGGMFIEMTAHPLLIGLAPYRRGYRRGDRVACVVRLFDGPRRRLHLTVESRLDD
ncbi:MAG: 30S ribosomal protein S1 [Bacillota bacterium]|nr:30S ribosomal protein S1 [Bacillota bacterium]